MKKIIYVTGNSYKFEIAQKALAGTGINIEQISSNTPEIQSTDVVEIAKYSAHWVARELDQPVVVTDAGYYIEALNGFPGPFIKYINQWLTAEDLLRLMSGHSNRKIVIKGCLAYCEPDKEPVTFLSVVNGTIADRPVRTDKPNSTSINQIFIPEGYDKVETEIGHDEMVKFWSNVENYWHSLAEYLSK